MAAVLISVLLALWTRRIFTGHTVTATPGTPQFTCPRFPQVAIQGSVRGVKSIDRCAALRLPKIKFDPGLAGSWSGNLIIVSRSRAYISFRQSKKYKKNVMGTRCLLCLKCRVCLSWCRFLTASNVQQTSAVGKERGRWHESVGGQWTAAFFHPHDWILMGVWTFKL